ncbi:hypothetical protein MACH16_18450 [Marinomonas pontica]|uniref:Uncharacterized protein n=1 Tax=Marinomonas pontica TaxID=264739 RepID=A0ABM8FDF7_9GAMM|nr:hypothetical protein MACH16_18450 [Marinomonas pontica]
MTINIRDLLKITEASTKHKKEPRDILFEALEGNCSLYVISDKDIRETLVPCRAGELHHVVPGEFIDQYQPMLNHLQYVDIQLGQPLALNKTAIKHLIINQCFSEVELFREQATVVENQEFDFWKTEREIYDWEENLPEYASITLDHVLVSKSAPTSQTLGNKPTTSNTRDNAPRTALKVIALLMHHLAKNPKYASGKSPNKSQIKELLIELAADLGVNNYGLSKVDERLLTDAMKHLEEQKN